MVTEVFGELLYHPESGCSEEFPSPEALKYHIILSTKPPKEYLECMNQKDRGNASPEERDSSDEDLTVELDPDEGVSLEMNLFFLFLNL